MAEPLVQAYRLASSVLVKLDEAHLAWIAADRAVVTAGDDLLLAATAALSLAQTLRALDQYRLALTTAIAAAHQITQPQASGRPERDSVHGALLLQAALAAASTGDAASVRELMYQASSLAGKAGDEKTYQRTSFSLAAVELVQVVAQSNLGETRQALCQHETVIQRGRWLHLPAEHRAAYLLDITRTYLESGDILKAGRTLTEAHRTAPAEVRHAPSARKLVTEVARSGSGSSGVNHLATTLGLAR